MKNSVILKVTNDKYEFILDIYDTTKELAIALGITISNARQKVGQQPQKKKYKYVRCWFKDEQINEKGGQE